MCSRLTTLMSTSPRTVRLGEPQCRAEALRPCVLISSSPVVGAKTDHHHNLLTHPSVPIQNDQSAATECPALSKVVSEPKSQEMDDKVCPVIGPATTILPPDHPDPTKAKEGDVCPVTKAKVGHHKDKVQLHPSVQGQEKGAVCPVTGQKA
jgi:hypothetical protein